MTNSNAPKNNKHSPLHRTDGRTDEQANKDEVSKDAIANFVLKG